MPRWIIEYEDVTDRVTQEQMEGHARIFPAAAGCQEINNLRLISVTKRESAADQGENEKKPQ